ncbi:MAG: GNAT family N-acetyltransferase [Clostridiales bacterium]|nr:GNAT family N-acetyltransferase [Clostridiales bacterium]
MRIQLGQKDDIDLWMRLVEEISWNFPGLETDEKIAEHRKTVLRFISKSQALCEKDDQGRIIGVLLFSRSRNMICCLGVSPLHRRRGIASRLLTEALKQLDRTKAISVSTFRENDEKGIAPRALYQKFGFVADVLTVEFGYPNQVFLLHPLSA